MTKLTTAAIAVCLATAIFAKPPVPRPAAEFTISSPSGSATKLSAYRGKVVLIQFLYTTCPHCQAAARMYSKLQTELGPRGLQVAGIAFNPEVQGHPEVVRNFAASNNLRFPVSAATTETVMQYLGIPIIERFTVPEILIVDRRGMIRAQSDFQGSPELQDQSYLRSFLNDLLK